MHISKVLNLKNKLFKRRKEKFEKDNKYLSETLQEIWAHFLPNKPYVRQTNDWQLIGFQGSDPYTDLRASGLLFIDNFMYLIDKHPKESQNCLSIASKQDNFFFFAVVGIHATMWVIDLLSISHIIKFLMVHSFEFDAMQLYQELFCQVVINFTYKWDEEIRNIMEFNTITQEFLTSIQSEESDIKDVVIQNLSQLKKKL